MKIIHSEIQTMAPLIVKYVFLNFLALLEICQVNTQIYSALRVVIRDFLQIGTATVEKIAHYRSSDDTRPLVDMKIYRGGDGELITIGIKSGDHPASGANQ